MSARSRSLLAVAVVLSAFDAQSQPRLVLDRTEFQHAAVLEGSQDTVLFTIPLPNKGNQPLRILSVRTGCGCSSASHDPFVAAGETGTARITVDLKGRDVPFTTHVVIVTDSYDRSESHIDVYCDIVPHTSVDSTLAGGSGKWRTLAISSRSRKLRFVGARTEPVARTAADSVACRAGAVELGSLKELGLDTASGRYGYLQQIERVAEEHAGRCRLVLTTNQSEKKEIRWLPHAAAP